MLKPFLKFETLDTQAQQRGAVVQGRSLSPYRLRYKQPLCAFAAFVVISLAYIEYFGHKKMSLFYFNNA
jgi:hypothetical protein